MALQVHYSWPNYYQNIHCQTLIYSKSRQIYYCRHTFPPNTLPFVGKLKSNDTKVTMENKSKAWKTVLMVGEVLQSVWTCCLLSVSFCITFISLLLYLLLQKGECACLMCSGSSSVRCNLTGWSVWRGSWRGVVSPPELRCPWARHWMATPLPAAFKGSLLTVTVP